MKKTIVPRDVIAVVADVIGAHYYSHTRLDTLFPESGATGDPPDGNCVDKCRAWFLRCNQDPTVDAFDVLGNVLMEYMEFGPERRLTDKIEKGRARILKVLSRNSLTYGIGGKVLGGVGAPSRSLSDVLREHDLKAVETEFDRAIKSVESDPGTAVTAASSILEALLKTYIEDQGLESPNKETITRLWKVVANDLGFDPSAVEDDDIKKILSGLSSVIDGIGSFRTHVGSAHGRGRKRYLTRPRHARLAVHASHTLTSFILETWEERSAR